MGDGAAATTTGPFALVSVLGEGGGGVVYEANHLGAVAHALGPGPFALKVLHEELALSERERARFLAEAHKMQKVRHDGLLRLLDAGELPDGRPYLLMPRLFGETLGDCLARGALPVDEAVRIFGVLARAVQAIHDAGMVHRDIKPENVFLAREAPGGPLRSADDSGAVRVAPRPVLLDFGIARDLDDGPSTTTANGRIRGTPAYMAPERFFGTPASVATDIYELGVVLYMMLSGRLPWGPNGAAHERLNPTAPPHVPHALARLALSALSMRPEVRPPSAARFAELAEASLAATDADEGELPPQRTADLPRASVDGASRGLPSSSQVITKAATPAVPAHAVRRSERPGAKRATVVASVAAALLAGVTGFSVVRARLASPAVADEPQASARAVAPATPPEPRAALPEGVFERPAADPPRAVVASEASRPPDKAAHEARAGAADIATLPVSTARAGRDAASAPTSRTQPTSKTATPSGREREASGGPHTRGASAAAHAAVTAPEGSPAPAANAPAAPPAGSTVPERLLEDRR
jgi:serine/threonine-protein kinase